MSQAETDNAKKTILVVMTDGYENASKEVNQAQVKANMKKWEDRKWEVVFLGANFDAVETVSGSVGVSASRSMNLTSGNYMKGMETLTSASVLYASCGDSINFTTEDKAEAAGELDLSQRLDAFKKSKASETATA